MADLSNAELIDLVIRRADDLRKAGVLSIELGGFKAQLSPYQPPVVVDKPKDDDEQTMSKLFRVPGGLPHLEVVEEKVGKK